MGRAVATTTNGAGSCHHHHHHYHHHSCGIPSSAAALHSHATRPPFARTLDIAECISSRPLLRLVLSVFGKLLGTLRPMPILIHELFPPALFVFPPDPEVGPARRPDPSAPPAARLELESLHK